MLTHAVHGNLNIVYANLSLKIYAVNVGSATMESVENITDNHESLNFDAGNVRGHNPHRIFSVKFSTDGRELVASCSDSSVYVYDLGEKRLSERVPAHRSSVITACFADESGHVIYSGSDEGICKVSDRRFIKNGQASGVLVGHLDGVTFIDSRGDGRHFISNARDQTIKLWDIRKMSSNLTRHERYSSWQRNTLRNSRHPNDISLATYKGHEVFGAPIRCYFSPEKSTGQKYIYTGSADGSVYIYDLLSGAQVAKLDHHKGIIRDCSWHPYFPTLVNSSEDGVIAKWDFSAL
ncbi:Ddb1- and cul4-associated factor [Heracleum sosnowskyi]|uniref:Ddb1- and cul4-associated factor n=1 Tax=Heracleum sosnowskyi TaxID=360622 RepID=A0AAD8LX38_9APIA|nr:Ddb1- and cul4-associated factor [Heracleum sosnowskyi]